MSLVGAYGGSGCVLCNLLLVMSHHTVLHATSNRNDYAVFYKMTAMQCSIK